MPPRRPGKRGEKLFAELRLLDEQEVETNPFHDLGLDQQFARLLLDEDPSGGRLRRYLRLGPRGALARIYHDDTNETGNRERFREIQAAYERVEDADLAALVRWSKTEAATAAVRVTKQQVQREQVAARAAELVRLNMELGSHPQHFSQAGWAQGILLQQGDATLLARPRPKGGLQVIRGENFAIDQDRKITRTQAFDFQTFMLEHGSFGLEPEREIAAYFDGTGRATILNRDLSFNMDITDAVASYRKRKRTPTKMQEADGTDAWSRVVDPSLLITRVPDLLQLGDAQSEFLSFPLTTRTGRWAKAARLARNVPMEVAGSIADADYFRAIRFNRAAGAVAIGGSRGATAHFGMAAIPVGQLAEQDVGYTPLIAPRNSLVLFDPESRMPVVTDAQIVGMLGNGAQV